MANTRTLAGGYTETFNPESNSYTYSPGRTLAYQPGEDQFTLDANRKAADTVAQNTPVQNFNIRLMEMLKQYQSMGTRPFAEQSLNAQENQAQRVFNTPSNLIGASPALQSQVRGADVSAIQPTISSANQSQQTFGEQLGGFGDAITRAQGLVQQFEQQRQQQEENAKNDMRYAISVASEAGSAGLESLLKANPNAFKLAGLDPESYIAAIKSQESAKAKQQEFENQFKLQQERRLATPKVVTSTTGNISPTAQAVIDGVIRLEDLTPTVRGQIAPELQSAGFKSGPKLSSGQQDDLASMDTVAQQIQQILDYNGDGKLEGVGFGTGPLGGLATKIFGTGSEEAKNVRSLIGQIKGTIAKLRGGTSFTPNEEKLLNSYTPDINENSASAVAKLNGLLQFIANKKANTLQFAQERGVPESSKLNKSSTDILSKYGIK